MDRWRTLPQSVRTQTLPVGVSEVNSERVRVIAAISQEELVELLERLADRLGAHTIVLSRPAHRQHPEFADQEQHYCYAGISSLTAVVLTARVQLAG